jgi:hypothetical protein
MAMSDVDTAGLSDQERAALQEDSEDEATLKAIVGKAGPEGDDADEGDDDEADAGKADAKGEADDGAADDAEGADPAKAAAAAEPEKKDEPAKAVVEHQPVVFTATAPEDAAEQIKALRTEKATEFKKLMDGEITPEEYSAKEDEILGKISAIDREVTTANVATKLTLENAQRSYFERVNRLLDSAKADEGIDYRGNKVLHAALDATVRDLATDPANADKPEAWFLQTAHQMVKDSFNLSKPAPKDDPADKKKTAAGKAPDLSGVPPTVRSIPAAADSEDGGEFAHLGTLKGMQLERAVALMTPEQQQRWAEAD